MRLLIKSVVVDRFAEMHRCFVATNVRRNRNRKQKKSVNGTNESVNGNWHCILPLIFSYLAFQPDFQLYKENNFILLI